MKWMIASDLHGSAYYCKKMLEAYDREGAQRLLLLGDILLHGHTHVPACTDRGDYIYMNPGSLSIPKEDSWNGYMILEHSLPGGCHFAWKDLDGEVKMEFGV